MTDNMNHNELPPHTESEKPGVKSPFDQFVEHQRKALDEAGKAIDALLPDSFKEHSKESRREFVKGMKVLVDAAITEMEKASREFDKNMNRRRDTPSTGSDSGDRPSSTGATKVKVQVD